MQKNFRFSMFNSQDYNRGGRIFWIQNLWSQKTVCK